MSRMLRSLRRTLWTAGMLGFARIAAAQDTFQAIPSGPMIGELPPAVIAQSAPLPPPTIATTATMTISPSDPRTIAATPPQPAQWQPSTARTTVHTTFDETPLPRPVRLMAEPGTKSTLHQAFAADQDPQGASAGPIARTGLWAADTSGGDRAAPRHEPAGGAIAIASSQATAQAAPPDGSFLHSPQQRRKPGMDAPWAGERNVAAGRSNNWPTAFLEHDRHHSASDPAAADPAARSPRGPIQPIALHDKLARICGGLARDIRVAEQPDETIDVNVEPVNQGVEQELMDRLLKVPELSSPRVRFNFDLLP